MSDPFSKISEAYSAINYNIKDIDQRRGSANHNMSVDKMCRFCRDL